MNNISKVIAAATGALILLGALFGGVPYYIRDQVAEAVAEINENAAKDPAVIALEAQYQVINARLDAIDGSLLRIDTTVGVFSSSFIAYLERQAE